MEENHRPAHPFAHPSPVPRITPAAPPRSRWFLPVMSVEHVRPGPDGDVRLDLEQRFASRAVVQDIVSKMPPAASPSNPLADQQWVKDHASQAVKDKADKAAPQTAGNFAALTQDGNLEDSRTKPSDFVGKAALFDNPDTNPTVKSSLLPSYVDDVVEYASLSAFPQPGETGKIYVALDTNIQYRWSGTQYTEIAKIITPSTSAPLVDGTASAGSSEAYSRGDHRHPTDTTRASVADATLTPIYSDTPAFSEWVCDPATITYSGGTIELSVSSMPSDNPVRDILHPKNSPPSIEIASLDYSPTALSRTFALPSSFNVSTVTATRTRTDIIGYTLGSQTNKQVAAAEPLLLARYYPEGNVKSAAEFTEGIKYNFDTTNHTATVKPFCNTGNSANDNSSLVGRVVIPPFVDAQDNGYISDDGTRFKVVGVGSGSDSNNVNENLTAVIAPSTVANIEDKAFRRCTKLASVSLPAATSIGENAFNGCTKLASISLPIATNIVSWAFVNCTSLKSVSLPAATSIGDSAFRNCTSLKSVSLPAATSIKGNAFNSCYLLVSVSLPAATSIEYYAFIGCTSLASIDFGATLSSVPTLGANAFDNVPKSCKIIVPDSQYDAWTAASGWSSLVTRGYKFLKHSEWEYVRKYEIDSFFFAQYYPDGSVKSAAEFTPGIKYDDPDTSNRTITVRPFGISGDSDNDNSSLVGRVVIPPFVDGDGNPYISDDGTRFKVVGVSGGSSQGPNTKLTSIIAPNTLTDIGHEAFSQCTSLASLSLPAATSIGDYAFFRCTSLTSVDFDNTPRSFVPTLGVNAFDDVPTTCKIIVPYTQYDAWIAAENWRDLQQEFVRHPEKADKPATFTTGNLAKFDANGNPTDSGKKPSDFQTALSSEQIANIAAVPNKATKADATLTERFSAWAWEGTPPTYEGKKVVLRLENYPFALDDMGKCWVAYTVDGEQCGPNGDPVARDDDNTKTTVTVQVGGSGYHTATRTALPGYQLGSQDGKPLASEAEADALRNGKLDKSGGTFGDTSISFTDEGVVVFDLTTGKRTLLSSSDRFLAHRDGLGVRYFAAPSTSGTFALTADIPYDRITITTGQLQDHAEQKVTLNAATTTLTLPALTDPTGKVSDFGIDVVNGYKVSGTPTAASFSLAGTIGTDYNLIVPEGEDWSEMSALAAGEMAVYYFSLSAFQINDKPTWEVMKKVVELVPVPVAP